MTRTDDVDLEQICSNFAYLFLDKDQGGDQAMRNNIRAEVDFSGMTKTYSGTKWTGLEQNRKKVSNIVWSTVFVNMSKAPRTFNMNAERTTESTFTMDFRKAFHIKGGLDLTLTPPSSAGLGLQVGFTSQRRTNRSMKDTIKEELKWEVSNSIVVGAGKEVQAMMVIVEDAVNGDFEETVTFDGKVSINFTNRKTGDHIFYVNENVRAMFDSQHGFGQDDQGRPYFTVKGMCHGRHGVDQVLTLTEGKARKSINTSTSSV